MKEKEQKGSVVIEATIALTTFMFAVVIILSIVNICLVQARVGVMINNAAKDISQYTYIYGLLGLNNQEATVNGKASKAKEQIDTTISGLTDVSETIGNMSDLFNSFTSDAEFQDSFVALLKGEIIGDAKSVVGNQLVKAMIKERLSTSETDPDAYLKRMGIEGGLNDIDFSGSVLCYAGQPDIKIIAKYPVHVIKLLNIDVTYNFTQCAATKGWFQGGIPIPEKEEATDASEEETDEENPDEDAPDDEEPEEAPEEETKTPEDLAAEATKNGSVDMVMIGADSVLDLNGISMTYFQLNSQDYNALSADEKWEVKKAFLTQQMSEGKTFFLSDHKDNLTGEHAKEVEWLESQGYTFEMTAMGVYKAVKQ